MGLINSVTRYIPMVNKIRSVYDIGIKIRNHIYTRRNFKMLMKKHSVLLAQLEAANELIISIETEEAKEYCKYYAIPRRENE